MFTYRVSPARLTWPLLRRRTWLGLPSINMALLMDSFAPTPGIKLHSYNRVTIGDCRIPRAID
jgi:hypothetical protein